MSRFRPTVLEDVRRLLLRILCVEMRRPLFDFDILFNSALQAWYMWWHVRPSQGGKRTKQTAGAPASKKCIRSTVIVGVVAPRYCRTPLAPHFLAWGHHFSAVAPGKKVFFAKKKTTPPC